MAAKKSLISGCMSFLIGLLNYSTAQKHFVQAGSNYK